MLGRLKTSLYVATLAVGLVGLGVVPAQAGMRSTPIGNHLCKTVGGGKFVKIPGFPGERIDRRLLRDIRWMRRNFKIFITDGYATSGHAPNGEHPIGLALDIVPNHSAGGTWKLITRLAKKYEPQQNQVRPPFRWIGYDGDAGHGRGHHLHLSYLHSPTPPHNPARKVYTRICPEKKQPDPKPDRDGDGGGGNGGGSGGVGPGKKADHSGISASGISATAMAKLAPVVVEHD